MIRSKWLLVADVDGTLTRVTSIWEHLLRELGKWESHGLPNLTAYTNGEIDYNEFARLDSLAYKGVSRSFLQETCAKIDFRPGTEMLLERLKKIPR